jgi:L-2-hydroxyglutarate oxidase LhgO
VRPKVQVDGAVADDFLLDLCSSPDHPGLMHLLGIESPGLTASMALADAVFERT